ncbi:MAG: LD-carboxypeptidase [Bacteroidales bacterium]|nr:LD-carboxypeptidase [Bacteroidales bacterium]
MRHNIRLLFPFLLTILGASLVSCQKADPDNNPSDNGITLSCIQPDYLKAGDKVALISPSYHTPMENVEKTADVLRSWGFEPVIGPNVGKIVDGRYAGTVAERVSDIRWALSQKDVKAIICNRGGYGTIQLIDKLQLSELRNAPKWLIGFSDISTLHGLETRAGVMSIHGTMSSFLAAGGTDATSTLMRDLLLGNVPRYEVPAHPQNIPGKATGILVGGNLCTFTPNLGTQADATTGKDLILFIEEVEESMHNIDRQFNILAMNGVLDRCRGVILGEFTDCGTEFTYENVEAMLGNYLKEYGIPVLCGFPAGHGDVNLPLVMGALVTIEVRNDGATLSFNIDGGQTPVNTGAVKAPAMSLSRRLTLSGKRQ